MDYESIHGRDVTNFSSSQHRLPTVSAAAALRALRGGDENGEGGLGPGDLRSSGGGRVVATGVEKLDGELGGGVRRGALTEVWGPSMAGKRELGLKMAREVLMKGESVVWIDCSSPIPAPRLASLLLPLSQSQCIPDTVDRNTLPTTQASENILSRFHHYAAPTLAHLTGYLHLSATHPLLPTSTSLLVITSLSQSLDTTYPEEELSVPGTHDEAPTPNKKEGKYLYYDAVQSLLTSLQRIAATRNIAVVILNQATLKEGMLEGPIQVPSWETGVQNRLILWRVDTGRQVRVVRRDGAVIKGAVIDIKP